MKIFFNNSVCDVNDCQLSPADRGFLFGDGVFTTIKADGLHLLYFSEHISRLKEHAASIFMVTDIDEEKIRQQCVELININQQQNASSALRITLSRGISSRGIDVPNQPNPTVMITVNPVNQSHLEPVRLCYTSIMRNEYSPVTRIKSLNYLEPIMARHEAVMKDFDDGIMLNTRGAITECTTSNIFFITSNYQVLTPHLSEGVLNGIIRNKIISACKHLNIPIFQRSIRPDDVYECIEAFQTNCLIGISAVSEIDGFNFSIKQDSIITLLKEYCKC
jgi:branched-chain amino acid aminotransferase